MIVLWTLLGVIVGATTAPLNTGPLAIVSGAIAGVLVLSVFGVALGLLGGQVKETGAGALLGASIVGGIGLLSGSANLLYLANLGLLTGALAGATAFAVFRRIVQIHRLLAVRS
jgi:hypothetical protein